AREIPQQVALVAARGPGLVAPVAVLDHTDEVHELSAADEVVHEVRSGSHPERGHGMNAGAVEHSCGHETAPCDVAREAGPLGTEERRAHRAANAVRADDEIGGEALAARERERRAVLIARTARAR